MVQNINQFQQAPSKGDKDLGILSDNVISVQLASGSAELFPGDAVVAVDSSSKLPQVTGVTAVTDQTLGFIARNNKDNNYVAGDRLEIAISGTVLYLEAGGAIGRFAEVEVNADGTKVVAAAGTNPAIGTAFDKAAADGDLVRVIVQTV